VRRARPAPADADGSRPALVVAAALLSGGAGRAPGARRAREPAGPGRRSRPRAGTAVDARAAGRSRRVAQRARASGRRARRRPRCARRRAAAGPLLELAGGRAQAAGRAPRGGAARGRPAPRGGALVAAACDLDLAPAPSLEAQAPALGSVLGRGPAGRGPRPTSSWWGPRRSSRTRAARGDRPGAGGAGPALGAPGPAPRPGAAPDGGSWRGLRAARDAGESGLELAHGAGGRGLGVARRWTRSSTLPPTRGAVAHAVKRERLARGCGGSWSRRSRRSPALLAPVRGLAPRPARLHPAVGARRRTRRHGARPWGRRRCGWRTWPGGSRGRTRPASGWRASLLLLGRAAEAKMLARRNVELGRSPAWGRRTCGTRRCSIEALIVARRDGRGPRAAGRGRVPRFNRWTSGTRPCAGCASSSADSERSRSVELSALGLRLRALEELLGAAGLEPGGGGGEVGVVDLADRVAHGGGERVGQGPAGRAVGDERLEPGLAGSTGSRRRPSLPGEAPVAARRPSSMQA
jgi:hypothetical protein